MPMERREKFKLVAALVLCVTAGFIGSLFTSSGVDSWYQSLQKPPFNPPSWVFGPVWTLLYLMMGGALYLVWKRDPLEKPETRALTWFFIQLALNVLWSFFFFYLRQPALAFFEIIFLWLAIIVTVVHFFRINRWAGVLLLPYLVWVSFAAVLNFAIWRLNY